MKESGNQISIGQYNRELPFFPNMSYIFTSADIGNLNLPAFMWIEAYFDAMNVSSPQLAVWGGHYNADESPQVNIVRFAYSGQMKQFKGKGILSSGVDIRGVTITSTTIGANPANLSQVIVHGGMI